MQLLDFRPCSGRIPAPACGSRRTTPGMWRSSAEGAARSGRSDLRPCYEQESPQAQPAESASPLADSAYIGSALCECQTPGSATCSLPEVRLPFSHTYLCRSRRGSAARSRRSEPDDALECTLRSLGRRTRWTRIEPERRSDAGGWGRLVVVAPLS